MEKYTQKQLRGLVESKAAIDISYGTNETRNQIEAEEGYLNQVGYAAGLYGCNGMLFSGHNRQAVRHNGPYFRALHLPLTV